MANKKILIADDEKTILKMLESRLKSRRYDVIKASNGNEALEKARQTRPDLLILDLAMPEKNGYQVCRELKNDPAFKHIPVIILSAWVRDKVGEDTELADLYITKPFKPEELLPEVERLLKDNSSGG